MKSFARPFSTSLRLGYSNQTAAKVVSGIVSKDAKVTKMQNGLMVVTLENHSPVSRVGVLYNAGSRREDHVNRGITHYMRTLAMMSSKKATGFGIARNIQQIGGNLTCTTTREQMIYSVEFLRDKSDIALENLSHIATSPAFKRWEISDIQPRLKFDLDHLHHTPHANLIEMIHQAAYRESLGNSLYIPPHNITKITLQQLEEFVASHYSSKNAVLVGVGVDHEELSAFGKKLFLNASKEQTPSQLPSSYSAGELREENGSPLTYITCVTEGVSLNDSDLIPLSILQHAIGTTPHTKYPSPTTNQLYKAASPVAKQPFALSCINSSYSDSGLFGLNVVCNGKDVSQILKAVVGVMGSYAKGKITNEDLVQAKAGLKASVCMHNESAQDTLEALGQEVLMTGQALSLQQVLGAVDKVTLDDVVRVSKKVITGKPSMACIGDLSHTPYIDELFSH